METQTIITAVGGALGGGGIVAAWLKFRLGWRQSEVNQQEKFLETLIRETNALREETIHLRKALSDRDEQITELQSEIKLLRETVDELRKEVKQYEDHLLMGDSHQVLEQVMNTLGHPAWLCDPASNQWFVNDWYAKAFKCKRKDFWTPINVMRTYPVETRNTYHAADMAVLESGVAHALIESVCADILKPESAENPSIKMKVLKAPIQCGARQYIFGVCYLPDGPATMWDAYVDDT